MSNQCPYQKNVVCEFLERNDAVPVECDDCKYYQPWNIKENLPHDPFEGRSRFGCAIITIILLIGIVILIGLLINHIRP
jgi:hypothetical protein